MTDTSKLIERLRPSTYIADPYAVMAQAANALEAKDADIEDLQKKLDACRAGFDRLARQVDGYKQAGKTTLDKFVGRKKP